MFLVYFISLEPRSRSRFAVVQGLPFCDTPQRTEIVLIRWSDSRTYRNISADTCVTTRNVKTASLKRRTIGRWLPRRAGRKCQRATLSWLLLASAFIFIGNFDCAPVGIENGPPKRSKTAVKLSQGHWTGRERREGRGERDKEREREREKVRRKETEKGSSGRVVK